VPVGVIKIFFSGWTFHFFQFPENTWGVHPIVLRRLRPHCARMKSKVLRVCCLSVAVGGAISLAGCVVRPDGRVAFAPIIIAAPQPVYVAPQPVYYAPGPVVVAGPVMVPDDYTWDGVEYVGLVGDQYYYLGPGNMWLLAEPFRLERFHGWERDHRDWREHAVHNDRFRTDHNGHVQPARGRPAKGGEQKKDGGR
jgi:hypothetical protein